MSQPINTKSSDNAWYQTAAQIFSGGIAGAVGITAVTPLMYIKMHMQEKVRNPQNPTQFEVNPLKWFKGAGGLAAWMAPQAAFAFSVSAKMRQKLSHDGKRELTPYEKLACSAASGGLLTAFVGPQELIYTQQKIAEGARAKMIEEKKLDPKTVPIKSATDVTKEVWKKHGPRGFYRAASETAGREMVSASILTYLAAEYPILAPVVGAMISQPLDTRKTHKQADFAFKAPMSDMLKIKAFSGLIPRIGIYLVFMNVARLVKDQCEHSMLPNK